MSGTSQRGLAIAWLLVAACEGEPASSPTAAPPGSAPVVAEPAAVVDLEGRTRDPLRTEAPATVLVFVSTHCPISNRYAPTLEALYGQWRARGVEAWLVYPDPDDDAAAIAAHRAAYALSLPALRDPGHVLVARAAARVTPEAAVFVPGRDAPAYHGRIDDRVAEFGKVRGEATTHELRDAVEAAVDGRAPKAPEAPAIGCYISDLR